MIEKMDMSLDEIIKTPEDRRRRIRNRRKVVGRGVAQRSGVDRVSGKSNSSAILKTTSIPGGAGFGGQSEPLPGRLGPPKFSANNSIMPPHAQQKGVVPKKLNANEKSSSGIVLEISNINPDATPQDVETVLSSFGDILDFVVLSGKDGKFKGTVRVTFKNWDEGADVIKKMNGQVADGRILSVTKVQGISIAGAASSINPQGKNTAHSSTTRTKSAFSKPGKFGRFQQRKPRTRALFERAVIASGGSLNKNTSRNRKKLEEDSHGIWTTVA